MNTGYTCTLYSGGTPVTRPTMGPMLYGDVTGVVASVKLKIWEWISRQKTAYSSIACLHAWLRWCTKPFSWQKQLLYLEKEDWSIIIEFIILSWVSSWVLSIYRPNLSDIQRWLDLDQLIGGDEMGILRLAFIFCCICSWMALHTNKNIFSPRILLNSCNYTRTFTPVNYHLSKRLQCLYTITVKFSIQFTFSWFPVVIIWVAKVLINDINYQRSIFGHVLGDFCAVRFKFKIAAVVATN
jgi:hypothetical protein